MSPNYVTMQLTLHSYLNSVAETTPYTSNKLMHIKLLVLVLVV